jgi:hypothetical protein
MKKTTPKTGMLAVALAKVRELKGTIVGLKDDLIEMNHRNDGLRQANAHASSKVNSLQSEVAACNEIIKLAGDAHSKTYVALTAEQQRANDLYLTNQKFAEDQHADKQVSQAAVNRLMNDNLHQGEEIERLNIELDTIKSVGQGQIDTLQTKINLKDLQIANLTNTLDRERLSHTMNFLSKSERIDELLIIEKNLTDRLHSSQNTTGALLDRLESLRASARELENLHAAHLEGCKASRQSFLSKVWQWLLSPY